MPLLLFSSSSPKHFFFSSCRELPFNLLLLFKNKTIWCNQPSRIWTNHCKMQNEKPACFLLLLLCFSLKLGLYYIIPPESNVLWCSAPHRIRGGLSLLLSLLVWVSELATRDRIEPEQGLLYVLPVMTPSWCVCSAYRKQTSRQERTLYSCFPFTPV